MIKITVNGSSINFVDDNNKLVGIPYFTTQCCEHATISYDGKELNADELLSDDEEFNKQVVSERFGDYIQANLVDGVGIPKLYDDCDITVDSQISFKLTNGKELVVRNIHNGYYGHSVETTYDTHYL